MAKTPKRAPDGMQWHRDLEGYGINVLPYEKRPWGQHPKNTIFGGRTIKRHWVHHETQTVTTLRCIQASNPQAFEDVVFLGVFRVIHAHFADEPPQNMIELFKRFDVGQICRVAKRVCRGRWDATQGRHIYTSTVTNAISVMVCNALMSLGAFDEKNPRL